MKIKFKDKFYESNERKSFIDLAKSIGIDLKDLIVAKVDGKLFDLSFEVPDSKEVEFLDFSDPEGKKVFWHSSAHMLADAVKRLYPDVLLGIGPSIDEGFYYDFYNLKVGDNDLGKIEKEMEKIAKENNKFERIPLTKPEAEKKLVNEKFKLELLKDLQDDITFYKDGKFEDLCRGPHIISTGMVKAIKLLKVSGAYWKGDSKREAMTRIYGISFPSKGDLENYLKFLEEKKLHDHKKIGRDLELFEFLDISPGSPFILPKGAVIYGELEKLAREYDNKYDYKEVITPLIAKVDLWKISGHFDKYRENMFKVQPFESDEEFGLKPMNCPFHVLIFKSKTRSYRELPLRFADHGVLHRYELEGALDGLLRTRVFQQNDAHSFVTEDQIEDEIIYMLKELKEIYEIFDLKPIFIVATRPDKRIGEDELWDRAENALFSALKRVDYKYTIKEKDGAFYGPKIDVYVLDFTGRPESAYAVSTIQVDFNLARRFDAKYIGKDDREHIPVVIHRSILGTFGRFMGIILSNTKGELPLWLSPVQVKILPINDDNKVYATEVFNKLKENGIRVEIDDSNSTLDRKIRDSQLEKVPYTVVIGEKEEKGKTIAVRDRSGKTKYNVNLDEFIKDTKSKIEKRARV
ncbi:MAG: threonine--tRNA ligase [Candidatus Acidifodinimicrobium sp.]